MNSNEHEKLEASIHRVLRSVPDRRAPAGLEGRVLAELGRRAALPWWHKSFAFWPAGVRAAFFVVSAVTAALMVSGLILLGRSSGAQQLAGGVSQPFAWLLAARDLSTSLSFSIRRVIAAIPPIWLYGVGGAVAICYAALAAIGAATYRTLSFGRTSA
jgi:hypothetical protein